MFGSNFRQGQDLVEVFFGDVLGDAGFLDRPSVGLQGAQRVGDVLKCIDHDATILRRRLLQPSLRRPLLVEQRHAVENGLSDIAHQRVRPGSWREELREL